jgi:hypothetical protein
MDTYTQQLVGTDIPQLRRFCIGPDLNTAWRSHASPIKPEDFTCVGKCEIDLPPTKVVDRGVAGATIAYNVAPVPPSTITATLMDYDQIILDRLMQWAEYPPTRIRLWIPAYMWITGYIQDMVSIPRTEDQKVVIGVVQMGRYHRDAPGDVLADPFYDDEWETYINAASSNYTFTVADASGFTRGDVIALYRAAIDQWYYTTITNVAGNVLTVADDLGGGWTVHTSSLVLLKNIILRGGAE